MLEDFGLDAVLIGQFYMLGWSLVMFHFLAPVAFTWIKRVLYSI